MDFDQKLHCYSTGTYCKACSFPLSRREKTVHFRCGHSYHSECVIAQDPTVCVACLADKSDQFTYYLNTLNPQYPKIKKANELLKKFEDKKFEMGELFKIEEYERVEKKE